MSGHPTTRILRRAALVAVGVAALGGGAAQAANFPVTSLGDTLPVGACDANCTLREAVAAANTAAGDDTITIPAGTITLAEPTAGTATPLTGDLDVTAGSRITIIGAGAAATVIDGGDLDRIFEVQGGAGLDLLDLTLRNGKASGSGVLLGATGSGASSLAVTRCVFSGHVDQSTAISGRAGAHVSVTDSVFQDNGAPISDLTKRSPSGTAIDAEFDSSLAVSGSTFARNRSGSSGGAIQVENSATATISGSTFDANQSGNDGGAVFVSNQAQASISASGFTANDAAGNGGALFAWNQTKLDVAGSALTGNTAHGEGGLAGGGGVGLWNQAVATVTDSTVSGNTSVAPSNLSGGGAFLQINETQLTVTRSAVDGNTLQVAAPNTGTLRGGGAFYLLNDPQLTVVNSTISGNSSVLPGGAFALFNQPTVRLINSTIAGNSTTGAGGVVFNGTDPSPTPGRFGLGNTIFAGNSAGGAPNACASGATADLTIFQSEGHNLESTDTCAFLAAAGDRRATDAGLAPLAANGGPTRTQAIAPGSPAVDSADAALCPATDQRGIGRPQLGGCDIGAFELTPPAAAAPAAPAGKPTPAKPRKLTAAQLITFASAKACISRRGLTIRLKHPKGVSLKSATVTLNGKRLKVIKGKRLKVAIKLKGLPKGRFTVKITVVTTTGVKVSGSRKYRTCARKIRHRSNSKV